MDLIKGDVPPAHSQSVPYIFILALLQRLNLPNGVGCNGSVFVPKCHPFNGHHFVVTLQIYRLHHHAVDTFPDFVQQLVAPRRILELHGNGIVIFIQGPPRERPGGGRSCLLSSLFLERLFG